MMELVHEWIGAPVHRIPENRRLATTLAMVVTTLVIAILHHSLGEALAQEGGTARFLFLMVVFGGTAGLTTYYWIRGTRQLPPRPAAYGARTGALVGPVAGFFIVLVALQGDQALAGKASQSYAAFFAGGMGLWAILMIVPGLLGGLAIERSWDPQSPSRGILYALAGFSAIFLFAAWVSGAQFPQFKDRAWTIALQAISQSIGWGLGLFLQRESCDPIFNSSTAAALPEVQRHRTVVIPIDSHRQDKPQGSPDHAEERPVSPQVLLLQPKGSRLWALVVLVLALAVGAWGYTAGIFRTDPEIVSEVDGKFEQDSGLHGRGLSAKSWQHVVTIAGKVDNTVQHTAAVQQASGVRGVRQIVDQIQVAPPAPPMPKVVVVQPPPAPTPMIRANISLFKSAPGSPARSPKPPKAGTTSRPTEATKSGGFFHHLFGRNKDKKDKNKNGH